MKGSYLNTRGIGILESEKIKLDGSPAELKENPLKFEKFLVDLLLEYLKYNNRENVGRSFSLTRKSVLEVKKKKNCC